MTIVTVRSTEGERPIVGFRVVDKGNILVETTTRREAIRALQTRIIAARKA